MRLKTADYQQQKKRKFLIVCSKGDTMPDNSSLSAPSRLLPFRESPGGGSEQKRPGPV